MIRLRPRVGSFLSSLLLGLTPVAASAAPLDLDLPQGGATLGVEAGSETRPLKDLGTNLFHDGRARHAMVKLSFGLSDYASMTLRAGAADLETDLIGATKVKYEPGPAGSAGLRLTLMESDPDRIEAARLSLGIQYLTFVTRETPTPLGLHDLEWGEAQAHLQLSHGTRGELPMGPVTFILYVAGGYDRIQVGSSKWVVSDLLTLTYGANLRISETFSLNFEGLNDSESGRGENLSLSLLF